MQGSAHEANNYLVQNVSSARVKKLWVNDAFNGNILCMYEISSLFFFKLVVETYCEAKKDSLWEEATTDDKLFNYQEVFGKTNWSIYNNKQNLNHVLNFAKILTFIFLVLIWRTFDEPHCVELCGI